MKRQKTDITSPLNTESLPKKSPIEGILYNVYSDGAPSATDSGKPLETCARCPLHRQPFVGGRGGGSGGIDNGS